jgi:hypothetical protein
LATYSVAVKAPPPRRVVRAGALALTACLVAAGAFAAGEHHSQPRMTILTGVAAVGDDEASVMAEGRTYGIEGAGSVAWVDPQGMTHFGGWPSCLSGPGQARPVRFGEIPVTLPDGTMMSQVVWVDCQS